MKMIIRDEGAKSNVLATGFSIIDVFGADLVQPADELVERLAVNHQTADAFGIVGNDVGCPYIFPVVSSKHVFSQYRILKKKKLKIYIFLPYPCRAFSPKKSPRCSERMYSSWRLLGSLMVTFT